MYHAITCHYSTFIYEKDVIAWVGAEMPFHHIHDVSAQLQGAEALPMVLIVIIVALLISRIGQGFAICVWRRYGNCQPWGSMINNWNMPARASHRIDRVY
jgi:hypothetical protein